jgi:NAD(P)-dependent dehydrogenase (short-subunit alcohol dehydrogenase family)
MPRFDPHPARRPALIAGASSGIGAATATELAARGFPVALGARRVDKCEEIAAQIRAEGGEAIALPLDVTDPDSVKAFVRSATSEPMKITSPRCRRTIAGSTAVASRLAPIRWIWIWEANSSVPVS